MNLKLKALHLYLSQVLAMYTVVLGTYTNLPTRCSSHLDLAQGPGALPTAMLLLQGGSFSKSVGQQWEIEMRPFSVTDVTNGSTVLARGFLSHIQSCWFAQGPLLAVCGMQGFNPQPPTCCKTLEEKIHELEATIQAKLDALIDVQKSHSEKLARAAKEQTEALDNT